MRARAANLECRLARVHVTASALEEGTKLKSLVKLEGAALKETHKWPPCGPHVAPLPPQQETLLWTPRHPFPGLPGSSVDPHVQLQDSGV